MPKHHRPKGFIIDQGLSPFNGKPYVAILDLARSTNSKTGDMAQVWILCRDTQPFEATKNGDDEAVCGNCQFRRQENGTRLCYVNAAWRAAQVWKSYKACEYEEDMRREHIPLIKHRKIRWGAYGDPAIIHPQVFWGINEHCAGHTGYTQAWREKWAQPYKGVFMAIHRPVPRLIEQLDKVIAEKLLDGSFIKALQIVSLGELPMVVERHIDILLPLLAAHKVCTFQTEFEEGKFQLV